MLGNVTTATPAGNGSSTVAPEVTTASGDAPVNMSDYTQGKGLMEQNLDANTDVVIVSVSFVKGKLVGDGKFLEL